MFLSSDVLSFLVCADGRWHLENNSRLRHHVTSVLSYFLHTSFILLSFVFALILNNQITHTFYNVFILNTKQSY